VRIKLALPVLLALAVVFASGRDSTVASSGSIERVTTDSGGSQGYEYSCCASMSSDGRFVTFTSFNWTFDFPDDNDALDIYVKDRQTGITSRVSVGPSHQPADHHSYYSAISADGRFVTFDSRASNLISADPNPDTNLHVDVFVHDRQLALTRRVSQGTAGEQGDCGSYLPSISDDGRFVAFESCASTLVPGDSNNVCDTNYDGIVADNCPDVFVRDRDSDTDGIFDEPGSVTTTLVSMGTGGTQGNSRSALAAISGNGRFVAFSSDASNLVPGDTNNATDIFLHDRATGITSRVSVDSAGNQSNGYSFSADLSADGTVVAFYSYASNLVPDDSNSHADIFAHDTATGETTRVSVGLGGTQGNDFSGYHPVSVSANGRFVAFQSYATNLIAHFYSPLRVFVHDLVLGTTAVVAVDESGQPADDDSFWPAISADGRYVAFDTYAALISIDSNLQYDVYLRDFGDSDGDGIWDPFEPDADGDTVLSAAEIACGSDPLSPTSLPERLDTPGDDDGDTLVNEPLPPGAEAYDCDGDGYVGTVETHVGTSDQDPCGGTGWPSDLVPGGLQPNTLNVQDLGSFITPVRRFGKSPPHPDFDVRWDLVPGGTIGGAINLQDVAATVVGPSGYPPMFGGLRAFGKACPWPP
jgi:hypothetical protein